MMRCISMVLLLSGAALRQSADEDNAEGRTMCCVKAADNQPSDDQFRRDASAILGAITYFGAYGVDLGTNGNYFEREHFNTHCHQALHLQQCPTVPGFVSYDEPLSRYRALIGDIGAFQSKYSFHAPAPETACPADFVEHSGERCSPSFQHFMRLLDLFKQVQQAIVDSRDTKSSGSSGGWRLFGGSSGTSQKQEALEKLRTLNAEMKALWA